MMIATRSTAEPSSFTPEATPQLSATNAVRHSQQRGLAARWVRVNGKLQCQWDMQ